MSNLKQPAVGEKPSCKKHPDNFVNWICSAGSCEYRALCKDCIDEHTNIYPHHLGQTCQLNDWYKQYRKLIKNFDPRENFQVAYHIEEMSTILKKEKYELEKLVKVIDESFETALNILFNKLKVLKDYLHDHLWRDYKSVDSSYNSLVKDFMGLQKINLKDEIFENMKQDLQKHFAEKKLKEYFDKVYTGHYDEEAFNSHLHSKGMLNSLKEKRKMLEQSFSVFDPREFETKWSSGVDMFIESIQKASDDVIFKRTRLDFLNTKSPKLTPQNKLNRSAKLTCLSSLENLSTSFISKVNDDILLTMSDSRSLKILDCKQSFRLLKSNSLGDELITSIEFLNLEPVQMHPGQAPYTPLLMLLGGNDDYPSLEVWDPLRERSLACAEDVHEYGLSSIKILKKEVAGQKEIFYVASGSADGQMKIWEISITKPQGGPDITDYKVQITLAMQKEPHDSYISSIVMIPACQKFPNDLLISCSHDKSLFFWEWHKQLKIEAAYKSKQRMLTKGNGRKEMDDEDELAEQIDQCGRKVPYAHSDRVNGILLIADREDYSDLEYYATGGGEGMIKIWKMKGDEMVKTFANSNNSPIFSMEYLKKDRIACTANEVYLKHYYVMIWDWRSATLLVCIRDHQTRVFKVVSLGENTFATCDKSKTIKLWQLEDDSYSKEAEESITSANFSGFSLQEIMENQ